MNDSTYHFDCLFISYIFNFHTEFSPFWTIDILSIEDMLKEWKYKLIVNSHENHYTLGHVEWYIVETVAMT